MSRDFFSPLLKMVMTSPGSRLGVLFGPPGCCGLFMCRRLILLRGFCQFGTKRNLTLRSNRPVLHSAEMDTAGATLSDIDSNCGVKCVVGYNNDKT